MLFQIEVVMFVLSFEPWNYPKLEKLMFFSIVTKGRVKHRSALVDICSVINDG